MGTVLFYFGFFVVLFGLTALVESILKAWSK